MLQVIRSFVGIALLAACASAQAGSGPLRNPVPTDSLISHSLRMYLTTRYSVTHERPLVVVCERLLSARSLTHSPAYSEMKPVVDSVTTNKACTVAAARGLNEKAARPLVYIEGVDLGAQELRIRAQVVDAMSSRAEAMVLRIAPRLVPKELILSDFLVN